MEHKIIRRYNYQNKISLERGYPYDEWMKPKINCSGLSEPAIGDEKSCHHSNMTAFDVSGGHNYECDFGCEYVKNLNPEEEGNGFLCITRNSAVNCSKLAYCCNNGAVGDIPGCLDVTFTEEFGPIGCFKGVNTKTTDSTTKEIGKGDDFHK